MKSTYLTVFGIGLFLIGMVAAAILISFDLSTNAFQHLTPSRRVEFADFVGILLACIAIITTFFGVFLGILSIYGYSSIDTKVRESAANAAREEVKKSLQPGGELYDLAAKAVEDFTYRGAGYDESSGATDPSEGKKEKRK